MRVGLFGTYTGLAGAVGEAGVTVVVHDGSVEDAKDPGFGERLYELFADLDQPRLFLLDLPVGSAIDRVVDAVYVMMEPGDVVIDPSPSYWCDSLRRYRRMRHRSLFYVDVALLGLSPPYDILVSGDDKGVALARPLQPPCRSCCSIFSIFYWSGNIFVCNQSTKLHLESSY